MALVLFAAFASTAPAATAEFVGGFELGLAVPSIEASGFEGNGNTGVDVGGFAGYRYSDILQWDVVELHYMSAAQDDAFGPYTTSNLALGTGVRLGLFGENSIVHPYFSMGVGGSRVNIEAAGVDFKVEWGFEWNVGIGVLVDASANTSMGVRYRYRTSSISDNPFVVADDIDINLHTIDFELVFGG